MTGVAGMSEGSIAAGLRRATACQASKAPTGHACRAQLPNAGYFPLAAAERLDIKLSRLLGGDPSLDPVIREYRKMYEGYLPADLRYLTLHKGHLMFVRPDEDRFATPELIQGMTVSGSASELRNRMRRLQAAGYNEVVVQVTPGCENMLEDWARVFETV